MGARLFGVMLAAIAVSGCSSVHPDAKPLPYIAIFKPPQPGQIQIYMTALKGGRLEIDQNCIRAETNGARWMPVFYPGTIIGNDANGVYIEDAETHERFRSGDRFISGGGELPSGRPATADLESGPIPAACRLAAGAINPGLKHARR